MMESVPDGNSLVDGCVQSKSDSTEDLIDAYQDTQDDLYYKLDKRKIAIILNHYSYDKSCFKTPPSNRIGTDKDKARLIHCLEYLDFEIKPKNVHDDPTKQKVSQIFRELATADHSSTSCLAVFIMTHGDEGGVLVAHDGKYELNDVLDLFTDPRQSITSSLAGKPKLFFIQACRGDNFDKGVLAMDGLISGFPDGTPTACKISAHADMLVMFSSYPGYVSWRESDGSWFMQTLCKQLIAKHDQWELLQILTFIIGKISKQFESANKLRKFHGKKQTPQITSTLRKLIKFDKTCDEAVDS